MANAKLISTMDRPVPVWIGCTNRPSDWRMPIVTIRVAVAAATSHHAWRRNVVVVIRA